LTKTRDRRGTKNFLARAGSGATQPPVGRKGIVERVTRVEARIVYCGRLHRQRCRLDSPIGSPAFQLNPSLVVVEADANPDSWGSCGARSPSLHPRERRGPAQIHFTSHYSSTTRPPVVKTADADGPFQHPQPLKPNLTQERGHEVHVQLRADFDSS